MSTRVPLFPPEMSLCPLGYLYFHRDASMSTRIPLLPSARPSPHRSLFKEKLTKNSDHSSFLFKKRLCKMEQWDKGELRLFCVVLSHPAHSTNLR